uniref:Uncharacterized protein n=1 Tax=Caenorhabditis japonica TaxID=281687 RepID=A0A8R1HT15_CAEJA
MTPISVTLERFIAVHYNRAYENCSIGYGVAIGILQFILAFGYLVSRYVYAAFSPKNFTFVYCHTLASSSLSAAEIVIPTYVIMVLQIVSIITFKILEIRNQRLRAVSDINLSSRFTLDQGKRSMAALKAFMHFSCIIGTTIALATSILHMYSFHFSKPRYMAIFECM